MTTVAQFATKIDCKVTRHRFLMEIAKKHKGAGLLSLVCKTEMDSILKSLN